MPDGSLLSVLWLLICVVAVSGLAYWFTKFVVGRGLVGGAAAGKGESLTILAQMSVGKVLGQVEGSAPAGRTGGGALFSAGGYPRRDLHAGRVYSGGGGALENAPRR